MSEALLVSNAQALAQKKHIDMEVARQMKVYD